MMRPDLKTGVVAHYVISHVPANKLGATKLNKVMWQADVLHYRKFGRSITGQNSYIRMQNGPVPNGIGQALDKLKSEGKVHERSIDTPVGARREFVWLMPCDVNQFSAQELEILHKAIELVCSLSASQASDRTHDALWEEVPNGAQMPIRAAAVIPGELEPGDIDWALGSLGAVA